MDKELNEAIKILKYQINMKDTDVYIPINYEAIETVLNYIQNSIPKKKVEDKIKELKKQSGGNLYHIQQTINAKIRLLKELLED